jgi:hypothetical protein
MSHLFENYIEATLLHNEELHDQARREHNMYGQPATVVGRAMSQIIHGRMLILDVDRSVMDLVTEKIIARTQGGRLPRIMLYAVGEFKLANVGGPNGLKCHRILANIEGVRYA